MYTIGRGVRDMAWEFDWLYGIQEIHGPLLDKVMVLLSSLGNAGLFWIGLSLVLLMIKKYRKTGLQMLITIAVAFILANLILKNLAARERPCWIDPEVELLIKSPKDYSFPSGHSVNGFAASVALLCNDRRLGIFAVILAALIAFSRLYLFVHFPTDVFAGILIGTVCALLVHYIYERLTEKKLKKS